jgi:GNAT superfamily N-acetyltransferase
MAMLRMYDDKTDRAGVEWLFSHLPPIVLSRSLFPQSEELLCQDKTVQLVAEMDDKLVGYVIFEPYISRREPYGFLWILVDPQYRNHGIGEQLWREICTEHKPRKVHRLTSFVMEGDTHSLQFAAAGGFNEEYTMVRMSLPLADFDPGKFTDRAQAVQDGGVRIFTLADVPNTQETRLKVYDLYNSTLKGMPFWNGEILPNKEFERDFFNPTTYNPNFCFIADIGGEWVGLTSLQGRGEQGLHHTMTGVVPSYRRRGIAYALKITAATEAKKRGFAELTAGTHEVNAEMRNLNETLGFKESVRIIRLGAMCHRL